VKYPMKLKYRGRVLATIYGKTASRPYRLYWRVNRQTRIKEFQRYGDAKREGDRLVQELAKGSQVTALTPKQAGDAIAAFQRLDAFFQATGRRISLLAGISEYCEAAQKLPDGTVGDAVERYRSSLAVVQRKDLKQAVADFIQGRKHLAESKDGKRPRQSPVYAYNVAMWLNEFADTFPGYSVCDLTKEHLNTYIGKFKKLSVKSRNDRRAVVKMLLSWCVAKDYLALAHRLFEAVDFKAEVAERAEIEYYRPKELSALLGGASAELVPVIALGGLAGIRREEILRLEWADVWRVRGKVEISARVAKGRNRRLVSICSSLGAWLRPYRQFSGPIWSKSTDALEDALAALRTSVGVTARRNGLRRGFVTHHFAMHSNENLTSAEAGHSPQMIHAHYKGLATRKDAVRWFAVKPSKSDKNVIQIDLAAKA
jgi:integrase